MEHKWWFERGVKEAIHIRALKLSLNRDGGRYNLPSIWNNIIKERLMESAMGTTSGRGGTSLRNLFAFPVVSNTIQRCRHTEEGCRDGRKLCKLSEHFYPVIMVKNICMYNTRCAYQFMRKISLCLLQFVGPFLVTGRKISHRFEKESS